MSRPVGGHYGIFTSAAKAILEKGDPYGTTFGWGVGPYFYSLTCGLSFFSIFSFLPLFWGLLLYMLTSWLFFLWGLFSLNATMFRKFDFDLWKMPFRNFFWLFLASEMTGGILASKVEVFMLGVLLFALKLLLERKEIFAGLLLGWITNWKFQPLPIVGLALLVPLCGRNWSGATKFAGSFAFSLGVAYLLPLAWYGVDAARSLYERQNVLLWEFMNRDWLHFQHIYTFLYKNFGLELSFETAQMVSVFFGALFAGALFLFIRKAMSVSSDFRSLGFLLAFALGAAYMNLFSPLSQSNAYILHTPLILVLFFFLHKAGMSGKKTGWILFLGYFLVSLAYSDFNPKPSRLYMYSHAFKPLGILVLLGLLLAAVSKTNAKKLESTSSH